MSTDPPASQRNRHVSLSDEDAVKEIVGAAVLDLWKAVNNLTRLRPSRRDRYRVAIFGSARAQPGSFVYEEVKRAAAAFSDMGCDIVTGGGPGLMQAANEGASLAGTPHRVRTVRRDHARNLRCSARDRKGGVLPLRIPPPIFLTSVCDAAVQVCRSTNLTHGLPRTNAVEPRVHGAKHRACSTDCGTAITVCCNRAFSGREAPLAAVAIRCGGNQCLQHIAVTFDSRRVARLLPWAPVNNLELEVKK